MKEKLKHLTNHLSDKAYIKLKFFIKFKKKVNLDNPKTYNEKLQYLKLYDRNPLYTTLVDKHLAKKYIADKIGKEYVIPELGIWDKFEDINFKELPDKFVLKTNHDCGGVVICKNKKNFDIKNAQEILEKHLKNNYYKGGREWPYKDIKPYILAEKYMEDKKTKELRDYKFFCFNGVPKLMFVATERQNRDEPFFDFFDMDYNHLSIRQGHPNNPAIPQKPKKFEEMKKIAAILSKGIPHVRIDFYEMDGQIYFGEFTFYHFSGFVPFSPNEWDKKIGSYINISQAYNNTSNEKK